MKASLLAAAAATAVKDKLMSKEQTGPTCKERSVSLPMEQFKLLSKEQFASLSNELVAPVELQPAPPCEERSMPLPVEQPKLLSKEQSEPLSKERVASVELQQEPEGEEEEENLQFGQEVVEHDDEEVEEVEEEGMETESDNGDSYQPSDESGDEGKFISFYLPFPPPYPNLTHFCGSFLEHLRESFLELVFVERTLNPFS
jgi:hypothetical protein